MSDYTAERIETPLDYPDYHRIDPMLLLREKLKLGPPAGWVANYMLVMCQTYVTLARPSVALGRPVELPEELTGFVDQPERAFDYLMRFYRELVTDPAYALAIKERFVELAEWVRPDREQRIRRIRFSLDPEEWYVKRDMPDESKKTEFFGVRLPRYLVEAIGKAVRRGQAENASSFVRSVLQAYISWCESADVAVDLQLSEIVGNLLDNPTELLVYHVFRVGLLDPDRMAKIMKPLSEIMSSLTGRPVKEMRAGLQNMYKASTREKSAGDDDV